MKRQNLYTHILLYHRQKCLLVLCLTLAFQSIVAVMPTLGKCSGAVLQPARVLVVGTGFGFATLLTGGVPGFVARVPRNLMAQHNILPANKGRGLGAYYRCWHPPPPLT